MEAIDSGGSSQRSQSSRGEWGTSQGGWGSSQGQEEASEDSDGGEGGLSVGEYALAHYRWQGEVAAVREALARRGEANEATEQQDAYVRMIERALEKGGPEAMQRAMFQAAELHTLAWQGATKERGTGLETIRAGDAADGEVLSEPQRVLDEVHAAAQRMNVVRGASAEAGLRLLEAAGFDVHRDGVVEGGCAEGDGDWADRVFRKEVFQRVLRKQRADKGLGADGWQGVLAKWAPEWMQERLRLAVRGVALTQDVPREWLTLHIRMIPKRGRDPTIFAKNRDIWMSPHGWGILTGCLQTEYELAQERMAIPGAYGFRARRGAPAVVLAVRLLTELASSLGLTLARCWVDLLMFFMGIHREFLYRKERAAGVPGGVTATMKALQEAASGRVITAHGLTKCFQVGAGAGQGCNCAPNRANINLSPLQWTLERLVVGYQLPTRGDRMLARVNMLWFADDANTVATSASAVSTALGVTWMVAWMSGNQVGVAEDGSKTAFSVSGPANGGGEG